MTAGERIDLVRHLPDLGLLACLLGIPSPCGTEDGERDQAGDQQRCPRDVEAGEGDPVVTEEAELGGADERDRDDPEQGDRDEQPSSRAS